MSLATGGTLVLPKMLEVIIINFADKIDATLEPAHNVINKRKLVKNIKYVMHLEITISL